MYFFFFQQKEVKLNIFGEVCFSLGIMAYMYFVVPYQDPVAACLYQASMMALPATSMVYTRCKRSHKRSVLVMPILLLIFILGICIYLGVRLFFNVDPTDVPIPRTIHIISFAFSGILVSVRFTIGEFYKGNENIEKNFKKLFVVIVRILTLTITFVLFFIFYPIETVSDDFTKYRNSDLKWALGNLFGSFNITKHVVSNFTIEEIEFDSYIEILNGLGFIVIGTVVVFYFAIDACRILVQPIGFAISIILGNVAYFVVSLLENHISVEYEWPWIGHRRPMEDSIFYILDCVLIVVFTCVICLMFYQRGLFTNAKGKVHLVHE